MRKFLLIAFLVAGLEGITFGWVRLGWSAPNPKRWLTAFLYERECAATARAEAAWLSAPTGANPVGKCPADGATIVEAVRFGPAPAESINVDPTEDYMNFMMIYDLEKEFPYRLQWLTSAVRTKEYPSEIKVRYCPICQKQHDAAFAQFQAAQQSHLPTPNKALQPTAGAGELPADFQPLHRPGGG